MVKLSKVFFTEIIILIQGLMEKLQKVIQRAKIRAFNDLGPVVYHGTR